MFNIIGYNDYKMAYIDRFEEMENILANPKVPTTFLEAMKLVVKTEEGRLELEENNKQLQIENKIKDSKIEEQHIKIEEDKLRVKYLDEIL